MFRIIVGIFVAILLSGPAWTQAKITPGKFEGDLVLYPPGCENSAKRICRLGGVLRYTSPGGKLVWETDSWTGERGSSGTTDGASIPWWAQPIIGDAYDPTYLKAAIIHDHYCYKENQVRSWRETHRMFYDALIDLGINFIKAKIMYLAVYRYGPKWIEIKPGRYCGENCIKTVLPSGKRSEPHQFSAGRVERELAEAARVIEANPDMTLEEVEELAMAGRRDDFFFRHGSEYVPTGPKDPNILPRM